MRLTALLMLPLFSPLLPAALAQSDDSAYKRPPAAIADIVEAKPTPSISMDPTRQWMMLLHREAMPPVSELAAPMLRLAGRRINPETNGPHGPRRFVGASLRKALDNATPAIELKLPAASDVGIGSPAWTRDGSRFAMAVTFRDRIELWVGETSTGSVKKVATHLNAASGGAFRWLSDGRLLVRLVNPNRGSRPAEPVVPTGPVVQEATGKRAQVRTFQDLLKNSYDEDLFDWVMSTQLAIVDPQSGAITNIGAPANWSALDPSPDAKQLLASRIVRPYSYAVPASLFSETYEVLELSTGKVVKELRAFNVKDREQIPIEGVEVGPRGFEWMEHAPATLLYTQALDGGDPKNKAEFRDQLFAWDAPFTGEPRELFKLKFRDAGTDFLETVDGRDWMLSSEYDRDRKWITTRIYDAANPAGSEPRVLTDRSINDRYNDPGSPLRTLNSKGRSVIRVQRTASGPALLMSGSGATPEGDRPFLDLMPLDSLKPQRLWRSEASGYESVVDVMADGASFITSFESPSDYPNYFSRTLNLAAANASPESAAGARVAITSFADPVPQVRDVKKELIKYTRSDGVELSGTLYLPPGYDKAKDGPLPLFLWAYPLEFTDKSTAGQVSSTPTTFTRMGGISHLCLVFAGYAVLDDATMPVIGDPETVNDTFVQQIVSSAQAAIDKCVELGVADRDRVAVGGHSYGAFMTANLLAHSELFRAGVARSGAYNRTLTPFGFQGERRTFWEAGDTYTKMSPFTYADKIKTPLLMIHGQIDNNPGTFPMQSERLFAAIKGLGGTAKLVMLPFESHGYSAMESALHVQAETVEWLDRYVKPAKQPSEGKATERTGQ